MSRGINNPPDAGAVALATTMLKKHGYQRAKELLQRDADRSSWGTYSHSFCCWALRELDRLIEQSRLVYSADQMGYHAVLLARLPDRQWALVGLFDRRGTVEELYPRAEWHEDVMPADEWQDIAEGVFG